MTTRANPRRPVSLPLAASDLRRQRTNAVRGVGLGEETELWISDGTSGGTTLVKDLSGFNNSGGFHGSGLDELLASGEKLYFFMGDGQGGIDLWVSDGTPGHTSILKDFTTPSSGSSGMSVTQATPFNPPNT